MPSPPNLSELKQSQSLSDQELIDFFKSNPNIAIKQLNYSERIHLKRLIDINPTNDHKLIEAYKITQHHFPQFKDKTPPPKAQPKSSQIEPPVLEIPQEKTDSKPQPTNQSLSPKEIQNLRQILHQVPQKYKEFLGNLDPTNPRISAQAAEVAGKRMAAWLKFQRGQFLPYLHGATKELIKTAFPPLSKAWEVIEKLEGKASWGTIHKALDPNALNQMVRLIDQKAIDIVTMPFSKAIGIVGRLGFSPFSVVHTTAPTYNQLTGELQSKVASRVVFAPLYALSRFGDKSADRIDKWTRHPTNSLVEHSFQHKHEGHIEAAVKVFSQNLKDQGSDYLNPLTLFQNKDYLAINQLIDTYNGFDTINYQTRRKKERELNKGLSRKDKKWVKLSKDEWHLKYKSQAQKHNRKQRRNDLNNFLRGISKKGLTRLAKNLRRTDRDPFSYLGILLGEFAWGLLSTVTINPVRYALGRLASRIPGVNTVRAYYQNLIHNTPLATSTRIGIGNLNSFIRAPLSTNAIAGGYLPYRAISSLFPNATSNVIGIPQITATIPGIGKVTIGGLYLNLPFNFNYLGAPAGAIGWAGGTFYQTALNNIIHGTPLTDIMSGTTVTMPGNGAVPLQVHWYHSQIYGQQAAYRRLFGFGRKTPVYTPTDGINAQGIPEGVQTNLRHFKNPFWEKVLGTKGAPLTRLTAFLYRSPYLRGFINGFLKGSLYADLALRFLPEFLPETIAGLPTSTVLRVGLPIVNTLWQWRTPFFADLGTWLANTRAGQWIGRNIYQQINRIAIKAMYKPWPGMVREGLRFTWRPYSQRVSSIFKNVTLFQPKDAISQARGWLRFTRNIINPGLLAGIGILAPMFQAAGIPQVLSYIFGAGIGITSWHMAGLIAEKFLPSLFPKVLGKFSLHSVTQLGWLGWSIAAFTYPLVPLSWGLTFSQWTLIGSAVTGIGLPVAYGILSWIAAGSGLFSAASASLISLIQASSIGASLVAIGVGAQVVGMIGIAIGLTAYTSFLVTNAFQSYQQGLQATSTSDCFDLGFNYAVIDYKPECQTSDLASLTYLQLLACSQPNRPTVNQGEQVLFHISSIVRPENQLFFSPKITIEVNESLDYSDYLESGTGLSPQNWAKIGNEDLTWQDYQIYTTTEDIPSFRSDSYITYTGQTPYSTLQSFVFKLQNQKNLDELSQDCQSFPFACQLTNYFTKDPETNQSQYDQEIANINQRISQTHQQISTVEYLSSYLLDTLTLQAPLEDFSGLNAFLSNPAPENLDPNTYQVYQVQIQAYYNQYQNSPEPDLNSFIENLQSTFNQLEADIVSLNQNIKNLNQTLTQTQALEKYQSKKFYYLASGTQIDVFLLLTYIGDSQDPLNIYSSIYSLGNIENPAAQACRANNSTSLNPNQSSTQP